MKTLYIDCGMGAAGDMLTAALTELLPYKENFINEFNALGIPGVKMEVSQCSKCGILGTHTDIKVNGISESEYIGHEHEHEHKHEHKHEHEHEHEHEHGHKHEHAHSSMHDIEHIVSHLPLGEKIKNDIMAVYTLIGEAESAAHGMKIGEIHFHEVGTMDAVADITAVCMLMERIAPEQVIASPVHVGSGQVKCAHGILPVPAPATAYILRDVPIYGGKIQGELCTPTGAALLKHFATSFGDMPVMKTEKIGYGMGTKDFERANCVRCLLGQTDDAESGNISELICNLDDMTPERLAYARQVILENGALEVYTIPVHMKKSRDGSELHVLCGGNEKEKMISLIFRHTSTLGIRENICRRYTLARSEKIINTVYGKVRLKTASGYGVTKSKYEYDDLARIAAEQNMSIDEVCSILQNEK